jgi:hypothetical protein
VQHDDREAVRFAEVLVKHLNVADGNERHQFAFLEGTDHFMLTFLTHRFAFDVTECRKPVGLRNFASSESLPGVCPDPQRQELSTRNTCRALRDQTSAETTRGSRACPRLRQRSRLTSATGRSDVIR